MKKGIRRIVILNLLFFLLLLQGCDKKEDSRQTTSAADRPSATQTEQKEKKFDIEKVRKELSLNGKKFSLPCHPKDFGKNYYLDDTVVEKKAKDGTVEGFFIGLCQKKREGGLLNNRVVIGIKKEKKKKYEDMEMFYIAVDEKNRKYFDFQIGPVCFDSTKKEVLKHFGEPSKKLKTDKMPEYVNYLYETEQGSMEIQFQKEHIDQMVFKYKG